jgi:hypothetical protein
MRHGHALGTDPIARRGRSRQKSASKLNGVAYTYSERGLLRGVSREQLKMIHLVKKIFGGEMVDLEKVKGFPFRGKSTD